MINFAVVELTNSCNLRCKHCYGDFAGKTVLSEDDRNIILSNLSDVNCKSVTLSGGEPLLAGEMLFDFAAEIQKNGMQTVLVTNGTLVNQYPVDHYKVFNRIQVSIDGPQNIHDQIRGKGAFIAAIQGIRYLQQKFSNISMQMSISIINQYVFGETYQIAKNLGVTFNAERVSNVGRAIGMGEIDKDNYLKIIGIILKEGIKTNDPLVNPVIASLKKTPYSDDFCAGCRAGRGTLSISCNLDVYPCVRLPIKCGNLKVDTLKEITDGSIYKNIGNRENLTGKCGICDFKYICGGCRADAWASSKDYLSTDMICTY